MRKIQLSSLAERDLIGIWQYSLSQWGEAHRVLHVRMDADGHL